MTFSPKRVVRSTLLATYHDPLLNPFADRLRKAGKPHKVITTAVEVVLLFWTGLRLG